MISIDFNALWPSVTKYETKFYFQLFSEASVTSNGPAAKRVRNDSIDAIEPNSKKRCETVADVKHDVETKSKEDEQTSKNLHEADDETKSVASFDEIDSSNPRNILATDFRLEICLKCGAHAKGEHANVSYCFSEHMCDSKKPPDQNDYLVAICAIANAMNMYTNNVAPCSGYTTSTPNTSMNETAEPKASAIASTASNQPFNVSNVGRVLHDLLE